MSARTNLQVEELFSVTGKVAVVTGASRGIGYAVAQALVVNGARVYITARKVEELGAAETALAEFGVCHAIPADLSNDANCRDFAATVLAREAKLDILVNNAGASWTAPLTDHPEFAFDKLWAVNVKAPFRMTTELYPALKAAASPAQPSRVINIGSVEGLTVGSEETYSYSATKAAIHHLTRKLARRLATDHITVNALAPGLTATRMMAFVVDDPDRRAEWEDDIPLGRVGRPDDIAGAALYLCSRAGSYVTGSVLSVDGGLSFAPR